VVVIEGMLEGFAIDEKSLHNGGNDPHYNHQVLQLVLAGWLDAWRVWSIEPSLDCEDTKEPIRSAWHRERAPTNSNLDDAHC